MGQTSILSFVSQLWKTTFTKLGRKAWVQGFFPGGGNSLGTRLKSKGPKDQIMYRIVGNFCEFYGFVAIR